MDFGFGTGDFGDGPFGRADLNRESLWGRAVPEEVKEQDNGDLEAVLETFSRILDYYYKKIDSLPEQFHPLFAKSSIENGFDAEVYSASRVEQGKDLFEVTLKKNYSGDDIAPNLEKVFPASEETFDEESIQPTPGVKSDGWWVELNNEDFTLTEVDSYNYKIKIQTRTKPSSGDVITFYPPDLLTRIGTNVGILIDIQDPPSYTRRVLWNKNVIKRLKVSFRLYEFLGELYGFDVEVDPLFCVSQEIFESIQQNSAPNEQHAFTLPTPITYNGQGHVSSNIDTRWIDEDNQDFRRYQWVSATLTIQGQDYKVVKLGDGYIDVDSPINVSGTGIDYTLQTDGERFTDLKPYGQFYDEILADVRNQDFDKDYCYQIDIRSVTEVDRDTLQPSSGTGYYEVDIQAKNSISGDGDKDQNNDKIWIDNTNTTDFLNLKWGETIQLEVNNTTYQVQEIIDKDTVRVGSSISASGTNSYTLTATYDVVDDIENLGHWLITDGDGVDYWIEEIDAPNKVYVIYNLNGQPKTSGSSPDGEICLESQYQCDEDWKLVPAYVFRIEPDQVVNEPNAQLANLTDRIDQKLENFLPFHVRQVKKMFFQSGTLNTKILYKSSAINVSDHIIDNTRFEKLFAGKLYDETAADDSNMDDGAFLLSSERILTQTGTGEKDSSDDTKWLDDASTDFTKLSFDSGTLEVDNTSTYQVNSLGNGHVYTDSAISETGSNLDYILKLNLG